MTYNINLDLKNGEHYSFSCYNAKERNTELQNILSEYENDDIVYLDYDKEYASGDRKVGKIIIDNTKTFSEILKDAGVKTIKKDEEKESNFIHENNLEFMISRMWEELYNREPFDPYDKEYLKNLYFDLFDFDREDTWLLNQVLVINYDLWLKAYNEHFLIINLIGRIGAYIEEPFDYIETLYQPFSNDEKEKYMKEWGVK